MIRISIPHGRPAVRHARRALLAVLGAFLCVVAGTTIALAAGNRATSGGWSAVHRGPGTSPVSLLELGSGFLIQDGLACPFPRDCTVFFRGPMKSAPRSLQPFRTVNLSRGRWGRPRRIPGFATVFAPYTFGCTRPGTCLAAGNRPERLSPPPPVRVAVAAVEVGGTWHAPKPIPGLAALGSDANSYVSAESCARSGWCTLAGVIQHRPERYFLISERAGTWTKPHPIPGPIGAISCDRTGTCTAVGTLPNGLFALSGSAGRWGAIRPIAEPAAFQGASLGAVACSSPGNCTAIGEYGQEGPTAPQVLAVTERHGVWGTLAILPGTTGYQPINGDQADTMVTGLSCSGPGQCVMTAYHASDTYGEYDNIDQALPFISTQVDGVWHAASALPGLAALNRGGVATIASVSCGSSGNCAATGIYALAGCNVDVCSVRPFLATEAGGTWGRAVPVPGLAAQTTGTSIGMLVSCSRTAGCVAVGSYRASSGDPQTHLWASVRG